ncbi:zinc ribbon domain-containing protein [Acetobacterium wieringae]|uniref:zinc ribbon domain-containing protein n=1 Tax=Acetobacterium wieringae TaxID=52694 RepID=UPI0031588C32
MEVLLGILVFAGFIAIYWIVDSVLSKGFSAASKAAKQNILYRSEHKEGQELVRETLNFQTTAAMPVVMAALSKHVVTVEKCNGLAGVVYETSRSEDLVTYAYGNVIRPQLFEAVVALTENEGMTDCLFTIIKWTEADGIIETQSQMKKLRKQVKEAFESIDSGADTSGNNTFTGTVSGYCPNCGTIRRNSAKHCPNCGASLEKKKISNSANGAGDVSNSVKDGTFSLNDAIEITLNKISSSSKEISSAAKVIFSMDQSQNVCTECGASLNAISKFCPHCGYAASSSSVSEDSTNSEDVHQDEEAIDFTAAKKRKTFFQIIGSVLSLIAIVKFMFIGYYQSEAPLFFGILFAGCVCFYLASKIRTEE